MCASAHTCVSLAHLVFVVDALEVDDPKQLRHRPEAQARVVRRSLRRGAAPIKCSPVPSALRYHHVSSKEPKLTPGSCRHLVHVECCMSHNADVTNECTSMYARMHAARARTSTDSPRVCARACIVCVLPEPVCPYANRHTLYPSSTDLRTLGRIAPERHSAALRCRRMNEPLVPLWPYRSRAATVVWQSHGVGHETIYNTRPCMRHTPLWMRRTRASDDSLCDGVTAAHT